METIFVTMRGDKQGELALKFLAQKKHPTKIIESGQTTPPGSIAVFTPTGEITPEVERIVKPGARTKRNRKYRGRYLCCSAVRLKRVTPEWAQTTPFGVGIVHTQDRHQERGGTFASSLVTMQKMFADWDWTSKSLAPWIVIEDPGIYAWPETMERIREWRRRTDVQQLSRQGQTDLTTCRRIQATLEEFGGYFVKEPDEALQISPDHFLITPEQLAVAEGNALFVWQFWREALQLYLSAIEDKPDLNIVAQSVEGPITPEQREWQRRIAKAQPKTLPLFARADLSSLLAEEARQKWGLKWFLVEIQERIGGWGLVESWVEAIRQTRGREGVVGNLNGLAQTFAEPVKKATAKSDPVVALICPKGYEAEQTFFAERLRLNGVRAFVVEKDRLEIILYVKGGEIFLTDHGLKVDFLYRREINAASMALTEIGRAIMAVALVGNLVVEPPLNMLYDCKSPMAWVHNPELRGAFSQEVQGIFPPTALIPTAKDRNFLLAEERMSLREAEGQPYVIKYAGENIEYGFGGRAVYQTETETIAHALKEIKAGHPWIIQPRDRTTYSVRQWIRGSDLIQTRHGAGRLMFHYALVPKDGRPKIALACAQIRPDHWKAAGNRESIFQEIRVSKEGG